MTAKPIICAQQPAVAAPPASPSRERAMQMAGFAVMSYRENKIGGLMAQGLGTSMLQMGNIVLNPRIWIPPTLASMITGPIATMVFRFRHVAWNPHGVLCASGGSYFYLW